MSGSKYPVGSGGWLLRELKGANPFDKSVLFSLKIIYIGTRAVLKLFLGKEKREKFCLKYRINFYDFLYRAIEFLRLDDSVLVVFTSPKYGYKFYSRITRKVNNLLIHDVYTSMTDHEEEVLEQFSPNMGDIVVDVGAAFGFYTIMSSTKVGEHGKVVAIEPQPDIFGMLNRNINLNKLANVITLNYAISSKTSTLRLYSTYSTIPERAGQSLESYIEVSADTLDNLLGQLDIHEVNWIKVDVEGAELEVLKGAVGILSKSREISILVEVHSPDLVKPILELSKSYHLTVQFEKTYEGGNKHLLLRRINNYK